MNQDSLSLVNVTKWEELRFAMCNYPAIIKWRTKNTENNIISNWDSDWYYKFKNNGYKTIEWLEVDLNGENIDKDEVIKILVGMHAPCIVENNIIRVYCFEKDFNVEYL